MAETNYYEETRPTIWQRLGFGRCATPDMDDLEDTEGFVSAYLITGTIAVLGWRDRLRVLVSGKVEVIAATKTDQIIRRSLSRSRVSVLPPDFTSVSETPKGGGAE